ncbi:MAG: hypothetical protein BMS9Abin34_519 [Patescibacteria group bacterium]|nr:MAG: hypothetical protein BMS9Abin34_519 [Patescibacteria group bacterium]
MRKSSREGIAPLYIIIGGVIVLLIIIVAVSGGAGFKFNISKNSESSPSSSSEQQTASYENYENKDYGISMNYPGDWRMQEGTTTDPIVSFFSPREGSDDQFSENINVTVTDLSAFPDLSLTEVADIWVQENESNPSFTSFEVVSRESTSVSGLGAEQVTYTAKGQGLSVKGRTTIVLKDSSAYIFTYSAEAKSFDTFLKGLETALSSTVLN